MKSARNDQWWIPIGVGACLLCCCAAIPLLAAEPTGAAFLKIPVGARGLALAQANTALAAEAEALSCNTAAIISTQGALSFTHLNHFENTSFNHIGVVLPQTKNKTSFGFLVQHLSYPDQSKRDANGSLTGSFDASDLSLGVAAARVVKGHQMGTLLKVIRQEMDGTSAHGVAVDAGILSRFPKYKLTAGSAIRNLGPDIKYESGSFALPLTLSLGAAYQWKPNLAMEMDVHMRPRQDQVSVAWGTEYRVIPAVQLRAGYRVKLADPVSNSASIIKEGSDYSGLDGLAGGVGIHIRGFVMDYAFIPTGDLGSSHIFSLSARFK